MHPNLILRRNRRQNWEEAEKVKPCVSIVIPQSLQQSGKTHLALFASPSMKD